jgi:hypothetical protein
VVVVEEVVGDEVVGGCVTVGLPDTLTVFVPEPQPVSTAAPDAVARSASALDRVIRITPMVFVARARPPRFPAHTP